MTESLKSKTFRSDQFTALEILKNFTPHQINLIAGNENLIIPSSGVARVQVESYKSSPENQVTLRVGEARALKNVPFKTSTFGDVEGLPEPMQGRIYIVSAVVKSACPERMDLVTPADLVRDEGGNIIGCKSFSF